MSKSKKISIDNFKQFIEDQIENLDVTENDELVNSTLEVIKTGSLSLDISTGIGGIPRRKFTEIYGPESVGKTTLALSICDNATITGIKALYIDAENTLDDSYASELVKNHDLLTVVRPKLMEDALKVAEVGISTGEFGLIILDSIGGMVPRKVTEDELDDANVALLSRILTTFVQRNSYLIRKNNVAFVGLNQVRDKIGTYMGGYETPGGHAWKHVCSLRIGLSRSEIILQKKEEIGMLTKFVIKKNKLAPPHRSSTFPIFYGQGIDKLRDIIDFATMLGAIKMSGSYYIFDDKALGLGINKTMEFLRENPEVLDRIVGLCYNVINIIKEEKGTGNEEN